MRLAPPQRHILRAIRDGATLKVHRTLDGEKTHRLYPLAGEPETVERGLVESLVTLGLIQSNLKFPAATYVLTNAGVQALAHMLEK